MPTLPPIYLTKPHPLVGADGRITDQWYVPLQTLVETVSDLVSGIDELTGDVTAGPGDGTQAATIAPNAVTYAKMQDVSAASKLLGRGSTGSGDPQEITLGSGLSMSGSTLTATGTGGTVTTTGSPSSGNLAKFSGSTSITNTDLTGDLTTSGGVATTLANSGVSAATYGDSTHVAQVAVDAKGRVTSASNVAIASSTGDWVLIATSTPSSTGVVTFSSLGSYTHLKIIWSARSTETATFSSIGVTFNSDTGANYDNQEIFISNGTSGGSQGFAGASIGGLLITGASAASNVPGSGELTIPDYRGTTFYKTLNTTYQDQRAASSGNFFWASRAGVWRNTSAITRIDLTLASGNFVSGSKFSLYGVN